MLYQLPRPTSIQITTKNSRLPFSITRTETAKGSPTQCVLEEVPCYILATRYSSPLSSHAYIYLYLFIYLFIYLCHPLEQRSNHAAIVRLATV